LEYEFVSLVKGNGGHFIANMVTKSKEFLFYNDMPHGQFESINSIPDKKFKGTVDLLLYIKREVI
jgi:hypothetical protein